NDPTPIGGRNAQDESSSEYHKSSGGMDPRIVLATHHTQHARDSMSKAANTSAKLKRPDLGCVMSRAVVHARPNETKLSDRRGERAWLRVKLFQSSEL